jgi:hypothetical protein
MSNIYALIQSNSVVNIVIASSTDIQDPNYTWIDITSISPQPGINWTYNGTAFTAPTPLPGPTEQQIIEAEIQVCIDGFNAIMVSYAAQNVLAGITAAGKTALIADTLSTVMQYGQSGSLTAAITALEAVTLTDEMSPFLTSAIVTSLVAQATAVLESL